MRASRVRCEGRRASNVGDEQLDINAELAGAGAKAVGGEQTRCAGRRAGRSRFTAGPEGAEALVWVTS